MLRKPICPKTLEALYEGETPIKDIAALYDCDMKTIRRRAKELGLVHPLAPKQRRRKMDAKLTRLKAVERYEDGESLMAIAKDAHTSVDVVRPFLERKGIKIRSRVEQVAATMAKYGTCAGRTGSRLYLYERDKYGLVTCIKIYINKSRKPIIHRIETDGH